MTTLAGESLSPVKPPVKTALALDEGPERFIVRRRGALIREGVVFGDGMVVVRSVNCQYPATATFEDVKAVENIYRDDHIVWLDRSC
jgi:hypothetical protein